MVKSFNRIKGQENFEIDAVTEQNLSEIGLSDKMLSDLSSSEEDSDEEKD
jgi:hypothetical protein